MDCGEDCPVDASSSSIDTRAIKSSIAEIDLSWAEHKGYSTNRRVVSRKLLLARQTLW